MRSRSLLGRSSVCRFLFGVAGTLLIGCSTSSGPTVKPEEAENLNRIETAYEQATAKLGRPPMNEQELRPFLEPHGDPVAILRSPRDGLPYVIIWGRDVRSIPFESMPPPFLAYEQQGMDGRRTVLTAMGVLLLSEEEVEQGKRGSKP